MTRAEFLRGVAWASAGWLVPRPLRAFTQGADDRLRARVARIIEAYDRQGIHRTATTVDEQSAEWLAGEARRAGSSVAFESFPLARVDVRTCFVQIGDRRIEGLPLFDGTFTDARGVTGAIGPPEAGTPIALVRLDTAGISSEGRPIAELRRSGRHSAIVAVTMGTRRGLTPTNAPAFTKPFGPPVVQVSSEDATGIEAQAAARADVRVVAHAGRTVAQGRNVVARVEGQPRDLPRNGSAPTPPTSRPFAATRTTRTCRTGGSTRR